MADLAETLIAEEEGRSASVYRDTRNLLTIGIGCLVDPSMRGAGLCDAAIDAQFAHDSARARQLAADLPGYQRLNEVQQAVLVSMCFQIPGCVHWPQFTGALAMDDVKAAAAAGRDSDWWRIQTPKRAEREMQMLETGVWQPRT